MFEIQNKRLFILIIKFLVICHIWEDHVWEDYPSLLGVTSWQRRACLQTDVDSYLRGNIGIKVMKVKICFQMVPGRKPATLVIDMERAVENSLRTVFGDTDVIYCE